MNNEIFTESKKYMPGGVNSPVRAFLSVNSQPPIIVSGKGQYITDEDGNTYLDFVGAWGPMILGHCDADVVNAITSTASSSIAFGAPTNLELQLAKHICSTVPNVAMLRMVNSGTEATMSAVKLARGYTNREKIVKFAGCYHGHFDGFLVAAGSGVATGAIPGSAGVPVSSVENTLIAQYNSLESLEELFSAAGTEIAAVILEPVAGNMGVVPAKPQFLKRVRELCTKHGALLIFDEVMSGFRVAYGGAQTLYNVVPDLITFAKIMGGGLPCGAYGGRADIMSILAPLGPVYQAGTMSGNPVVMAAGLATLEKLYKNQNLYENLEALGAKLEAGIKKISAKKSIDVVVNRCGSMLTIFFSKLKNIENYEDAKNCDTELYARYFNHMLKNGINLPPSQFEAFFISTAHTEADIEKFLQCYESFTA